MSEFPKYNDVVENNIKESSIASYDNGRDLLSDANVLYEMERYARATSLAILAWEEFSKALILHIASANKRWDKQLFKGLIDHRKKQAIAVSLSEMMDDFLRHISVTQCSLIPSRFDFESNAREKVANSKKIYINDGVKDKIKQFAQFVDIDENGAIVSTPKLFTKTDAANEIDYALRFGAYVESAYGKRSDDDPLFRSCTTLRKDSFGIITINHKSGVTIHMKPFVYADNLGDVDKTITNPSIVFDAIKSFDPDNLDDKQKADLAKIYKAYDFLGQIRAEMQKLGLRGSDYLDEVEQMIKQYA